MGKEKYVEKCVNVKLPRKDWNLLDADAEKERRSRNRYVEHVLAQKVEELSGTKNQRKTRAA